MTISDRRWAKAYKKGLVPLLGTVEGWAQVAPPTAEGSNWTASDPDAVLFQRSPSRIGDDLRSIWAAAGRSDLTPLASVAQELADRIAKQPLDDGRGDLSPDVYAMH